MLPPPDNHYLSAALGWLELGNPAEAGEELARISSAHQGHPEVLEPRWEVCAAANRWEAAYQAAELLVRQAPERQSGWIQRAYALRRAKPGGLPQAYQALFPALERFPKLAIIPYNLACYTAQMGQLEPAWAWLQRAVQTAGAAKPIQALALADPDLQPLWERIKDL